MTAPEEEFEQMEVRTKWPTEDDHFTPWLAKNLGILGRELGMKLELVQKELPVGPYYLDILAKETNKGVLVAIENQLEGTDLIHLGQLLTYATGCGAHGAHIAIWVAREFGYEHAQALHRLNEWTSERIRFYGVKVEVVRKTGDSDPEPRFRKVVYPGGWNKDMTWKHGQESPEARKHREFFQPLIADMQKVCFADRTPVQHFGHTGRLFRSKLHPKTGYAVSLDGKNDAWVTLHVQTDDKESSKHIFDKLKADREQIERSIDAGPAPDWHWRRHDAALGSSINIRKDGSIDDSPEKLEETREWMRDMLPKFKEVFDPLLEELLAQIPSQSQP